MVYGLVRVTVPQEKVSKGTFIHRYFRVEKPLRPNLSRRMRGKPHRSRRKMQITRKNVGQHIVPGYCSVPQASLPSSFCACPWWRVRGGRGEVEREQKRETTLTGTVGEKREEQQKVQEGKKCLFESLHFAFSSHTESISQHAR